MRRSVTVAGVIAAAGAGVLIAGSQGAAWSAGRHRLAAWAGAGRRALEGIESRITDWGHRSIRALVAGMADLGPEDDVLDVACGSGAFLEEHASHVRHVAGLDLSEAEVRIAGRRLAERIAQGSAEVIQGDAAALPWEEGRFSVVTCMGSFGFFSDPGQAVSEVYRVLRPGGRTVLNMGWRVVEGTASHRSATMGSWVWNEADVRRMLEDAGFADVSVSYAWPTGDDRLANLLWHVVGEQRFIQGVKPATSVFADAPEARPPTLAGSGAH